MKKGKIDWSRWIYIYTSCYVLYKEREKERKREREREREREKVEMNEQIKQNV